MLAEKTPTINERIEATIGSLTLQLIGATNQIDVLSAKVNNLESELAAYRKGPDDMPPPPQKPNQIIPASAKSAK